MSIRIEKNSVSSEAFFYSKYPQISRSVTENVWSESVTSVCRTQIAQCCLEQEKGTDFILPPMGKTMLYIQRH